MVDPFAQQHLPAASEQWKRNFVPAERMIRSVGPGVQVENLPQIVLLQAPEDDYVVDPVHELGRKLTSGGFNRRAGNLLINFRGRRICRDLTGAKPIPPEINSDISRAPRFDVIITIVREKSTRRLSPGSRLPYPKYRAAVATTIRSLFDLIEENELSLVSLVCMRSRYSCVSIGLVSRCPK